jgi:hypothetical protein
MANPQRAKSPRFCIFATSLQWWPCEELPSPLTIGYYENRCLNLTMPNGNVLSPFKRCLSYQVFMSFASSKLKKCDVPADFASDIGKDWNNLRNDLLITRSSLETAIAEETDEGEHDFDNRSDT